MQVCIAYIVFKKTLGKNVTGIIRFNGKYLRRLLCVWVYSSNRNEEALENSGASDTLESVGVVTAKHMTTKKY